ncbi:outer membrane protein assembly factor BamB family protein [Streptomyces gilvus]|uniref:outer membrane protein assembly factor BamB family protein n=1 Tax=Streptomyces gilvus TaxID=2920937 RepID=UPI001F0FAE98|nr:PQQ-binding-like beta-propeller repeat protein [Streptomyces sp. CME 23]MCH5672236.1 PQQ-binding-like beta-propeller repeat protein [Streptomyces sp. CME 23]
MTTHSSPGQGAPQEGHDWAFRPRVPDAQPQPYGDQRRQAETDSPREGRPAAGQAHRADSGPRFDATMPLRVSEPRSAAHEAVRGPGGRTAPYTRPGGEPADRERRHRSAEAAVLGRESPRSSEPVTAQPATGGRGKRPGKTRQAGRIALVLAVLAAAGGSAAVLLKREQAAAVASKNLRQVWQIPAPAHDDTLIGSWLTDKLLVVAGTRGGLRAYDIADGSRLWSTVSSATAAKRGTVPCAMSPTLSAEGVGTVAFGKDGSTCTWLAGVKASTGRILWSMPLTSTRHPSTVTASTYVQDDVATIVSENFLGGVNTRTGGRVWGYKPRGRYCNAYGWGTDGTVLVDDYCLDKKTRFTLTAYDAKTGKVIWRKAESAHSDVTHILSGSPLVAAVHTARQDAVRVFDAHGDGRKLAVGNEELTSGNTTEADHSARLYGTVLATSATAVGGTAVDGFDTTTGAKLWTRPSTALAVPPPGEDKTVYAVTTSGSPQLITIDRRTGRTTPVAGLPTGSGTWSFTAGTVYVTPDGGVLELSALGSNGGVRRYR